MSLQRQADGNYRDDQTGQIILAEFAAFVQTNKIAQSVVLGTSSYGDGQFACFDGGLILYRKTATSPVVAYLGGYVCAALFQMWTMQKAKIIDLQGQVDAQVHEAPTQILPAVVLPVATPSTQPTPVAPPAATLSAQDQDDLALGRNVRTLLALVKESIPSAATGTSSASNSGIKAS